MRIIIIVLSLLIATSCYAEVKLFKFTNGGKVVGVSYSDKDGNITPPAGATATEITESEKDAAIAQQIADTPAVFSYGTLLTSINQKFTGAKAIQLAPYLGAMQGYCDANNWVGLKAFADGLIVAEIMTTDDYNLLNTAMKEQGVDLDSY